MAKKEYEKFRKLPLRIQWRLLLQAGHLDEVLKAGDCFHMNDLGVMVPWETDYSTLH